MINSASDEARGAARTLGAAPAPDSADPPKPTAPGAAPAPGCAAPTVPERPGAEPPPAISVERLRVSRGRAPVLHDVSFSIRRGEIVGLLGPSGCGKTTLMRALAGVQRIDAGTATVLGCPAGSKRLRARIGYSTQQASAYPDLTVRRNAVYFAALAGAGRGAADAAIRSVGLADRAGQVVSTLSGGQASRASIACALVGDPEVMVLDEPTVGLDPLTRESLWDVFRELARQGRTLLVSSHVMDEAMRCDRLILMRRGRVLGVMTPAQLLEATGQDTPDRAFLALVREDADDGAEGSVR